MLKLLLTSCHGFHLFSRLRKELDVYKKGELELLREALNSEIQFLKSVSFCVMNKAFILLLPASGVISTHIAIPFQNASVGESSYSGSSCRLSLNFLFYFQKLDNSQGNEQH